MSAASRARASTPPSGFHLCRELAKTKTKNPQRLPRCVAPPTHARATERQHRAAAGGQVRSLSSHKDNTIILKRSWSPVIEFSKGSGLLRGGGGQLLECGGSRGGGGRWALRSREQTIPEMDDLKSPAFFALGISSTLVTWQGAQRHIWVKYAGVEGCWLFWENPNWNQIGENRFSHSAVISRSRDTKRPAWFPHSRG